MAKPNLGKPNSSNSSAPSGGDDEDFDVGGMDEIDSKFKVPDGPYKLKCTDITKDTSEAGNDMWVWDFTIVEGPEAGKEFRTWTALTAGALWKLQQVLAAMGLHDGKSARVKFKRSQVIGKVVTGNLKQEEYKGRMSSKIDSLEPA